MLPKTEEIFVVSDTESETDSTIEVDGYEDMPSLLYPQHTLISMHGILHEVMYLSSMIQEAEEHELVLQQEDIENEHLERVWMLLVACKDYQEAIERHFESDSSDYVTGEDFRHNEIVYQLDDCDENPLKFNTLQTMIKTHKQYKNPRTRDAVMYFTKIKVLKH